MLLVLFYKNKPFIFGGFFHVPCCVQVFEAEVSSRRCRKDAHAIKALVNHHARVLALYSFWDSVCIYKLPGEPMTFVTYIFCFADPNPKMIHLML